MPVDAGQLRGQGPTMSRRPPSIAPPPPARPNYSQDSQS